MRNGERGHDDNELPKSAQKNEAEQNSGGRSCRECGETQPNESSTPPDASAGRGDDAVRRETERRSAASGALNRKTVTTRSRDGRRADRLKTANGPRRLISTTSSKALVTGSAVRGMAGLRDPGGGRFGNSNDRFRKSDPSPTSVGFAERAVLSKTARLEASQPRFAGTAARARSSRAPSRPGRKSRMDASGTRRARSVALPA